MNVKQGAMTGIPVSADHAAPETGQRHGGTIESDAPARHDLLGHARAAHLLAEVTAHRSVETPLCIGIFGAAGTGKSSFVDAILTAVTRLDEAAHAAGLATPFQTGIAIARVSAEPGLAPAVSLQQQISAALAPRFPRLVNEALEAGRDPHMAAQEANERLNEARQRLDAERRSLDGLSGRQAALADTVLFETAGSRIDSYARGARGRIERSARSFGLSGDPISAYKNAVREWSEARGPLVRGTGWLRVFWAYKGQGRLLLLAVALLLAAWGTGALIANETKLIDAVRSSGERMDTVADWMSAQWHWLHPAQRALQIAAALALIVNVVRGVRFLVPIHRGAGLLRADLDARRRDLDGLVAHQARRVETLTREVDAASQRAAAAEQRLSRASGSGAMASLQSSGQPAKTSAFFAALADGLVGGAGSGGPNRLVVAIDGLEQLPPNEAVALLATARGLLQHPGMITLFAADRMHLAAGLSETDPALVSASLDRLVQIPFTLEQAETTWADAPRYVRSLLRPPSDTTTQQTSEPVDAAVSRLDRPWSTDEHLAVEALAPWAGRTPRAIKRFVNLYRIARADMGMDGARPEAFVALALYLALQANGAGFDAGPDSAGGDLEQQARNAVNAAVANRVLSPEVEDRAMNVARTFRASH